MTLQKLVVILYTKPGCHLCDEVKLQMQAANCSEMYQLVEINIETDPVLAETYRLLIPVIEIGGVEVFKYRVSASAFRDAVVNNQATGRT